MKEYLFSRDASGRALITVKNGTALYPLRHIITHSPQGMSFGFYGMAPADTALSILYDLTGTKANLDVYKKFMLDVIATIDADEGGTIPEDEIIDWLKVNAPEMIAGGK